MVQDIYNDGVFRIEYNSSNGFLQVLTWKVYKDNQSVEKFFSETEARDYVHTEIQKGRKMSKEKQLMALCKKFIDEQDIHCGETIYQSDRVIENAYSFIEDVCNIVGYKDIDDE
jgi:hypothetical protein